MEKTCATCRWWLAFGKNNQDQGNCRRRAPVISTMPGQHGRGAWPWTFRHEGCGEHEPTEEG